MYTVKIEDRDIEYTDIDLNAVAATDVYDPTVESHVYFVHLENTGSTAQAQLEVTDGSNTVVLTVGQAAGEDVTFSDDIVLGTDEKLQINVTTAEGSALTGTALVSRGEQTYTA